LSKRRAQYAARNKEKYNQRAAVSMAYKANDIKPQLVSGPPPVSEVLVVSPSKEKEQPPIPNSGNTNEATVTTGRPIEVQRAKTNIPAIHSKPGNPEVNHLNLNISFQAIPIFGSSHDDNPPSLPNQQPIQHSLTASVPQDNSEGEEEKKGMPVSIGNLQNQEENKRLSNQTSHGPKKYTEIYQIQQPTYDPAKEFLVLLNSPGTPFDKRKQLMLE